MCADMMTTVMPTTFHNNGKMSMASSSDSSMIFSSIFFIGAEAAVRKASESFKAGSHKFSLQSPFLPLGDFSL